MELTREEIIKGNRIIAEFMGGIVQRDYTCKPYPQEIPKWAYVQNDFDTFKVGGFFYHLSWDWLMPVVFKVTQDIESVKILIGNVGGYCKVEAMNWRFSNAGQDHILNVWKTVVNAIRQYNSERDTA